MPGGKVGSGYVDIDLFAPDCLIDLAFLEVNKNKRDFGALGGGSKDIHIESCQFAVFIHKGLRRRAKSDTIRTGVGGQCLGDCAATGAAGQQSNNERD
jgi:hypothetical protein